jgi:CubicO group peptidase (beta-lactamase class C family)
MAVSASEASTKRTLNALNNLRPASLRYQLDDARVPLGERLAQLATPGASISVIDNYEVAFEGGFGDQEKGSTRNVGSDTLFQAGSISKLVFALAVMRLVQDGTLELDANVNNYLRSWRVPANNSWSPRITLRQLLSHTAGTTVHGFPGYPASGPWPTVPHQILDGMPGANTEPVVVDSMPGLQYRYSGGGTTIAQQVVVDVLGQSFPDAMEELVLKPVGMLTSTYEQPLAKHMAANAASGHPWNGVPITGGWHVYPEMAAAGLWTSAGDLARLAVDFMRALQGARSGVGLTRNTAVSMLRPQLPGQLSDQDFVGLGWFCTGDEAIGQCGHRGANQGFLAELVLFPKHGVGGVVMINSNQGGPIRREILSSIGQEYQWPTVGHEKSPGNLPLAIDWAGTYRSSQGVVFYVVGNDGKLLLRYGEQPPVELSPESDREFHARALDLRIQFESKTGVATQMTITQGGNVNTIKLTRQVR